VNSFPKKRGGSVALLVAGLLLVSLPEVVSGKSKTTAGKPSATRRTAVQPGTPKKSAPASFRAGRRTRRSSFKHRLARLRLEPQRVEEIQQALIGAGYLKQEPTGKWDDATRDAMRRYQHAHGFPTTGLPEAKSLMKLGLGPHPLPKDLDPTAQARPPVGSPTSSLGPPSLATTRTESVQQ